MNSVFKKLAMGGSAVALILPGIASAATIQDTLKTVSDIINMLVPIILALAIVFFLWGVLMYVTKAGAEKDAARDQMLWGIIAIAVMVSIWGLVGILRSTFGVEDNNPLVPATLQLNANGGTGGATNFQQQNNQ